MSVLFFPFFSELLYLFVCVCVRSVGFCFFCSPSFLQCYSSLCAFLFWNLIHCGSGCNRCRTWQYTTIEEEQIKQDELYFNFPKRWEMICYVLLSLSVLSVLLCDIKHLINAANGPCQKTSTHSLTHYLCQNPALSVSQTLIPALTPNLLMRDYIQYRSCIAIYCMFLSYQN